jgi:hypothetical protein
MRQQVTAGAAACGEAERPSDALSGVNARSIVGERPRLALP